MSQKEFLNLLYEEDVDGKLHVPNDKVKLVYDYFYKLRQDKNYDLCASTLDLINANLLPPSVLCSILTVTAPIKDAIGVSRENFFKNVYESLEKQYNEEYVEKVLGGLE